MSLKELTASEGGDGGGEGIAGGEFGKPTIEKMLEQTLHLHSLASPKTISAASGEAIFHFGPIMAMTNDRYCFPEQEVSSRRKRCDA